MPRDWFYNSPLNIYRAVSFKTRIWTGWTDFVAWLGPVLRRTALQADAYWTDVRTKGVALGY